MAAEQGRQELDTPPDRDVPEGYLRVTIWNSEGKITQDDVVRGIALNTSQLNEALCLIHGGAITARDAIAIVQSGSMEELMNSDPNPKPEDAVEESTGDSNSGSADESTGTAAEDNGADDESGDGSNLEIDSEDGEDDDEDDGEG